MVDTRSVLFELGCEELPPKALLSLSNALTQGIVAGLEKAGLAHGEVASFATPRRMAVSIAELAVAQPDKLVEKRGPAITAAYAADGTPSKALEGFLRSCGATLQQLETLSTDKGEWLVFRQQAKGVATLELLPDIIRHSLAQLPIPKRMRWGSSSDEFVRPVHWAVLLFGSDVITTEILGVKTDRVTRGHRFHRPGTISLSSPEEYAQRLETEGQVIASFSMRRDCIRQQAEQAGAELGGRAHIEDDLLDEVAALNEWPVAVVGGFEARYLALPPEVPMLTMQANQKYFPILGDDNKLLPHFITFSNIVSSNPASVRAGNERVVRPRLADGEFFWNQDRKQTLENRVAKLGEIIFQNKLGTLLDKTHRVQKLVVHIADALELPSARVERAALLAKADLLTEMVGEFPSLQGTMGRYYALAEGEPEEIASAIEEHYFPRQAGGALPTTPTGTILALADKLDTLSGIFSAGLIPTGDKDPYALRRAALGILRLLIEREMVLDLPVLVECALNHYHHAFDRDTVKRQVLDFITERLRGYCLDQDFTADEFEAVLGVSPAAPYDFIRRLSAVRAFRRLPEAASLASANKRIRNILKKSDIFAIANVDEQLFQEEAERLLFTTTREAHDAILPLLQNRDYEAALSRLALLKPMVDAFFDSVMVNVEDNALRQNRLGLVALVEGVFLNIADIGRLQAG